jgi:hypothetical protein
VYLDQLVAERRKAPIGCFHGRPMFRRLHALGDLFARCTATLTWDSIIVAMISQTRAQGRTKACPGAGRQERRRP